MRPDHPLARRVTITPADLVSGPFIALEHGSRLGDAVRKAFALAGEPFGFAVEVRCCNTACVLVEGGVGAAAVDLLSALAGGRHELAVRPFEPAIPVSACVMHAKSRPLSRLTKAFLREVRSAAQEVGARLA